MGRPPKAAADNIFYKCRIQASKVNLRFSSREGAAEAIGISASQLQDYETGQTKVIPAESAARCAEVYGAPEIRNYYCRMLCPLGRDVPELDIDRGLDRIAVKAAASLGRGTATRDELLDIAGDGAVTPDERPRLEEVLETLKELESSYRNLRAWMEKSGLLDETEKEKERRKK